MDLLFRNDEIVSFFGTSPVMAASIRVTKRCNLQCIHCYADSRRRGEDKDELSTEEVFDVIDQLSELSINEIFFTGGEPLLRQDIVDILQYTSSKGIRVLMSTNGSLVTENFLRRVENVDFKLFQVSIDGPEDVHNTIRGSGSFSRAIKALELASFYLKKNVAIGSVLSRINAHCIDEILDLAHKAGADVFALMFLIPSGRATIEMYPSAEQIKASLDAVFASYRRLSPDIRFAHNTTIPPALYPHDLIDAGINTKCALCSFPYTIAIEANGDIAPCDGFFGLHNFTAGNVRELSLKDAWEQCRPFHTARLTETSELQGVCRACRYQNFCAGGCRASAYIYKHKMNAPDPICEMLYQTGLFPANSLKESGSRE